MRPRGVWGRSGRSVGSGVLRALVEEDLLAIGRYRTSYVARQLMCAIGLESLGRAVLAQVGAIAKLTLPRWLPPPRFPLATRS